jgi:hypothetical protein
MTIGATAAPFQRRRNRDRRRLEAAAARENEAMGRAERGIEAEERRLPADAPSLPVVGAKSPFRDGVVVDPVGFADHDAAGFWEQASGILDRHPFGIAVDRALAVDPTGHRRGECAVAAHRHAQCEHAGDDGDCRADRRRRIDVGHEAGGDRQAVGEARQPHALARGRGDDDRGGPDEHAGSHRADRHCAPRSKEEDDADRGRHDVGQGNADTPEHHASVLRRAEGRRPLLDTAETKQRAQHKHAGRDQHDDPSRRHG